MTLISRVLGLLRDVVIAAVFPVGAATDAFFVAFRIPNLLRRLFAEGAFSLAFVPVLAELKAREDRTGLRDLIDHVAGTLSLVLFGITVVGMLAAPLLITLFAPGFLEDAGRHELASAMLRITFPYILFISLTAFAGGILNTYGRFAVPAFTPVLLNLALIGCALWLSPRLEEPVTALAWGVLIAGVAQLAFQVPFLFRLGLLPRPRLKRAHEGVRRILRLMTPALFGSSVAQLNLLINTIIASFLTVGSVSWLYFSDRFVELPLALLGVALGTVILPRLSQEHTRASAEAFNTTLDWALRLSIVVAMPAMLGLMVLAGPILATVINHGSFTAYDVEMASLSLATYALGLPAFVLVKILAPGFYSRQDTATPVKIGIAAVAANLVFNAMIVLPWVHFGLKGPHAGLALATALAGYVNAGLLYLHLRRHGVFAPLAGWPRLGMQVGLAALGMVGTLDYLNPSMQDWLAAPALERAGWLGGLIVGGATTYLLLLLFLGLRPRELLSRR
jgi:putative peptidoglycan lipid II flippase